MSTSKTSLIGMLRRTPAGRAVFDDPKKAGFLGVLVLVLGIVGVRAVVVMTPSVAPASMQPLAVVETAINPTKSGEKSRADQAYAALRDWLGGSVAPLSHNIFAVHLDYFPSDGSQASHSLEDGGFWEDLAKSVQLQADERGKRRQVLDAIMHEAAQLKFQSTVMGSRPQAMVNDKLVGVGDVIGSFRVMSIESRKIIVEHVEQKGIRLAITFDQPEGKK